MSNPPFEPAPRGFTLIELMVALAIIATLLSLVAPRYFSSVSKAEEAVLKENLLLLRDAVDKHFSDTGRYPNSLEELVGKKYLRSVPMDPITQSASTWIIVPPDDPAKGGVFDIQSGAKGNARDGTPFDKL
jgi:general secretion pathway protein G